MTVRHATLPLVAALAIACHAPDPASRARFLESDAARHLVGIWDVSFIADSMSTVFRLSGSASHVVTGTMAFTLNRRGAYVVASLEGITHEGAYDLDFSPFGFTTRPSDAPSVALARVGSSMGRSGDGDSLLIVLSPGSEQIPVRMLGVIGGDTARGTWSALAYSAGGGTGRFVMRRHPGDR